jgi:hypothetical protein
MTWNPSLRSSSVPSPKYLWFRPAKAGPAAHFERHEAQGI